MRPAPREEPLTFGCQGETLVGMLHRPPPGIQARLGVVIIVGGPQYRAGSSRQFLRIARQWAAAGHAVLRFDVRGMGDSTGAPRGFDALTDDTAAAIDTLQARVRELEDVVLLGLCDGASAALIYLADRPDPRVKGLCLLNPWVRSAASQARTTLKHYYLQRLREPAFWTKLLSGRIAGKALRDLASNLMSSAVGSTAPAAPRLAARFQDRMARGWQGFAGHIFIAISGKDFTAKEFLEFTAEDGAWAGMWRRPRVTRLDMPEADHTFSGEAQGQALQARMLDWLASACTAAEARA